jgi:hypothetical protein
MSALDWQIAALKSRRRSAMEFGVWKPGPFYYLYVPLCTLFLYFLTGPPWWRLTKLAATAFCFGFLCYLPVISNRVRFWMFFRWPNRRLDRKIASLQAQLDRQRGSRVPGA